MRFLPIKERHWRQGRDDTWTELGVLKLGASSDEWQH
jgi:hypothetical protein